METIEDLAQALHRAHEKHSWIMRRTWELEDACLTRNAALQQAALEWDAGAGVGARLVSGEVLKNAAAILRDYADGECCWEAMADELDPPEAANAD